MTFEGLILEHTIGNQDKSLHYNKLFLNICVNSFFFEK